MTESTTNGSRMFSPAASLAAIGLKVQELQVFEPIRVRVQIAQKAVKHAPGDKLYEAFITMLAGAHGLVEINSRLCRAVGRAANVGCVYERERGRTGTRSG